MKTTTRHDTPHLSIIYRLYQYHVCRYTLPVFKVPSIRHKYQHHQHLRVHRRHYELVPAAAGTLRLRTFALWFLGVEELKNEIWQGSASQYDRTKKITTGLFDFFFPFFGYIYHFSVIFWQLWPSLRPMTMETRCCRKELKFQRHPP